MANYDLDEVVEQSPVSDEVVEVTTGQEEVKTESDEKEVPATGETSSEVKESEEVKEETKTEEDKTETQTEDKAKEKPATKKASDQFTTDPQALKAAENLAIALREDVNFKKMTIEETRQWYDENRPRLGREGFKGDRSKAKELNQAIQEEDKFTRLESKLDNFIETQKPKEDIKPETKSLTAPVEPEFDEDVYNELVLDDPKEAARMMRDYRKAQNDYINKRIEFEGMQLAQTLMPIIQPMSEGYKRMTQKEQEAEIETARQKKWDDAEKSVIKFIETQPNGTFAYSYDECGDVMKKLAREDWATYKGIEEADGTERALFKLYQNALKEKMDSDKETRLAQLEQEIAALKNGETLDQINAAKGAARITQTNGGVTTKTPQKPMTEQEKFEAQMRGNSQVRGKYDLEY